MMVDRCAVCRMRVDDCMCALITPMATRARFSVVLHRKEVHKPSNTGRLVHLALTNSELLVHGSFDAGPVSFGPIDEAYAGRYLLFPGANAWPLEALKDQGRPLHLIVPDGTWGQAQRMVKRMPDLAGMPRVTITPRRRSRYVLRRNQEPGRLCTLEAIAEACAVLEGEQVADELERLFIVMVERSLKWKAPERRALYLQLQ
jgi:DTW domain-containing protein YfiP